MEYRNYIFVQPVKVLKICEVINSNKEIDYLRFTTQLFRQHISVFLFGKEIVN